MAHPERHRTDTIGWLRAAVLGANYPDSDWYRDSYKLLQTGGLQPREDAGSWISRAAKTITGA